MSSDLLSGFSACLRTLTLAFVVRLCFALLLTPAAAGQEPSLPGFPEIPIDATGIRSARAWRWCGRERS